MSYLRIGSLMLASVAISYLYSIAGGPAVSAAAGDAPASETADITGEPADTTATDLDDFVVVQTKKLVQSDGAKLTYNVSEDPESKSSNLLDILRKVPGVTVDANEEVKVNGQSNFKILLNNREDPMLSGDIKTVLKSLPAGTIKKIEVISEPGAKYEAEGTGGILNIVTDRSANLSGFNTRLNAWVNAYQAGGSANGRVKVGNVMLGANISYNNGNVWPRSSTSEDKTEDLTGSLNHLKKRNRKTKGGYEYTGLNIDMSWEPDTLNLFTLSANFANWGNRQRIDEHTAMYAPDMSELWRMDRITKYRYKELSGGFQASYQHAFDRDDNTLVVSYMLDAGRNRNYSNMHTESQSGALDESPYIRQTTEQPYDNHIIQIDYSNQLGKCHKLEAGGKANIYGTENYSKYLFGQAADGLVEDPEQAVKVKQFKEIYAAYASYTGSFSKFGVTAGLRYEHTRMGLRYRIGDYPDFTTYLNDIVPNGALSYNFTDASTLRLAYQMRIGRPGIWSLNPFRNTSNPGTVQYGNPDLESEKSHSVSIGYTNYDHPLSGGVKAEYRYVNNSITDILFMRDGLMNSTYSNVGRSHMASFSVNADWRITSSLQWSAWVGAWYEYLSADSELIHARNKGWNCNVNTNINYTLPCKVRLSAYGGYYSGWIDLQSKGEGSYWYGIGASRSWLKNDALTLSLNLSNLFPPTRKSDYTQSDESVVYRHNGRYKQWNVGVSLSYTFGGLKSDVKRTAANVEKEEQSGGSKK